MPPPQLRIRPEALRIVAARAEASDATLTDVATALIQLGARHAAAEIEAELAALPPVPRTAQDQKTGKFKKAPRAT